MKIVKEAARALLVMALIPPLFAGHAWAAIKLAAMNDRDASTIAINTLPATIDIAATLPKPVMNPPEKNPGFTKLIRDTYSDLQGYLEELRAEQAAKAEAERQARIARAQAFKFNGVIDQGGWHYTWYSSRDAYHRNTSSWVLGDDLIYRTYDGYVVVACVSAPFGSIVPTPFGDGQILDTGCAPGTIDIYCRF